VVDVECETHHHGLGKETRVVTAIATPRHGLAAGIASATLDDETGKWVGQIFPLVDALVLSAWTKEAASRRRSA
jgi:hypothetical protein